MILFRFRLNLPEFSLGQIAFPVVATPAGTHLVGRSVGSTAAFRLFMVNRPFLILRHRSAVETDAALVQERPQPDAAHRMPKNRPPV